MSRCSSMAAFAHAVVVLMLAGAAAYTTTDCTSFDKEPSNGFKFGKVSIENPSDNYTRAQIFHNVGFVNGQPVDLRMTPLGKNPWMSNNPTPDSVVMDSGIAKLNFASGYLSKVNLCFVPAGATEKSPSLKVHKIAVSFFDMDGIDTKQVEKVTIGPIYDYVLPEPPVKKPEYTAVQKGDYVTFTASGAGDKQQKDNPTTSVYAGMTPDQQARSVTVHIVDRNCFSLEVDATAFNEIAAKNTRNIMITLEDLIQRCPPGGTTTPFVPPPTFAPTFAPVTIATTTPFVAPQPPVTPPGDDLVEVEDGRVCRGYEKQWSSCEDLPKCDECTPIDCKFTIWHDWYPASGCIGLDYRQRNVETVNNECGTPCKGPKIESRPSPKVDISCSRADVDCVMSVWSAWSICTNALGQKQREREVKVYPRFDGSACAGPLSETKPCSVSAPRDCAVSPWAEWTDCPVTCGGGYHVKMRRVLNHALHGGATCDYPLRWTEPCNTQPCGGLARDCVLSAWGSWAGCGSQSPKQRYRTRLVKVPSSAAGAPCHGVLSETQGCAVPGQVNCTVTPWSEWAACTASCDGGQTYRKRMPISPPVNGGDCPFTLLKETKGCGTEACDQSPNDCQFGPWSGWSNCSANCGQGITKRERKVVKEAGPGGTACVGPLREVFTCEGGSSTCGIVDCKWGIWEAWSGCSCPCGGGTKRRDRVVEVLAMNGGMLCSPQAKSEMAPCNTQSCHDCIDGSWMDWTEWTECSATCGSGFRARHRDIATQPNECGKPVTGYEDDYEKCEAKAGPCEEDKDCEVGEWADWTGCSNTCFGVKERHRQILHYAKGNGAPCVAEALKLIAPCNPTAVEPVPVECKVTLPRPCKMAEWSQWSSCTETCGGGQKERLRHILTPAALDGDPCNGGLHEYLPCNTAPCPHHTCIDCKWTDWEEWGACTKCGGQRYRHRHIATMANDCGRICEPTASKEAGTCHSHCADTAKCVWSPWAQLGQCSATCKKLVNGTWVGGNQMQQRQLAMLVGEEATNHQGEPLFIGPEDMTCAGTQVQFVDCGVLPTCDIKAPEPCKFGSWNSWASPTVSMLCERSRTILFSGDHGGTPCKGPLVQTKRCLTTYTDVQPCEWTDWGSWSLCSDHSAQRFRGRTILQMPQNGGEQCKGAVRETSSCSGPPTPQIDCSFSDWAAWGACSLTCGGGHKKRARDIPSELRASGGGVPCSGELEELAPCSNNPCPIEGKSDCVMDKWLPWKPCAPNSQTYRHRQVTPAKGGGVPCNGSIQEIAPCKGTVDCRVSKWTAWDICDRTCGGGQQHRQRQITLQPQGGGKPCPEELIEIAGCNRQSCGDDDNCVVGDWVSWGACSSTCGSGQMARQRYVVQLAKVGGQGCTMPLHEVAPCLSNPACPTVDCVWNDWSQWSSCSCDCDGGQRSRDRNIRVMPQPGGRPCDPLAKEELEPCNQHPCKSGLCTDGEWDDWMEWSPCTQTCKGGLTFRVRRVLREANDCGTPATGSARETRTCHVEVPCTPDQDCEFGAWTEWSDCTKHCSGVKRRSRGIAQQGRGRGEYCKGDLKQTYPCNPADGEDAPPECRTGPPVDCKVSDWLEWEMCSVSCGGGQRARERQIINEPQNSGRGCEESLKETEGCGSNVCPNVCTPTDCKWGDWGLWSACDKCGGQKKRFRPMIQQPDCGGAPCNETDAEQITGCERKCHEKTFCGWTDWQMWGDCTVTCGAGGRSRVRELRLHSTATAFRFLDDANEGELEAKFQSLREQTTSVEYRRHQELLVAFTCGLLSLSVATFLFRRLGRPSVQSAQATVHSALGHGLMVDTRSDYAPVGDGRDAVAVNFAAEE